MWDREGERAKKNLASRKLFLALSWSMERLWTVNSTAEWFHLETEGLGFLNPESVHH